MPEKKGKKKKEVKKKSAAKKIEAKKEKKEPLICEFCWPKFNWKL